MESPLLRNEPCAQILPYFVSAGSLDISVHSISSRWLIGTCVSGIVLALLGELLLYISAMRGGGILSVDVPPVTFDSLIVAIYTLLESRKSTQAHPKDAAASDVDSPGEP
jgi:hypothetical protein